MEPIYHGYRDALKDKVGIDISQPDWQNYLSSKLGGKNLFEIPTGKTLKDLIDGIQIDGSIITDLQTKLDQEKRQLQQQKITNQQLGSENLRLQQEISNRKLTYSNTLSSN